MCLVPTWTRGFFSVAQTPGLCTCLPTPALLSLPQPHSPSFHPPTEQVHLFHRTFALASLLPGMLWSCWTDSSSDVCSKVTCSGKASSTTPAQYSCQGEPASYLLPTQPLLSQPLVLCTISLLTWMVLLSSLSPHLPCLPSRALGSLFLLYPH